MKKLFLASCLCLGLFSCNKNNEEKIDRRILTFEDSDYRGTGKNWSSLIDNPQYYGTLLYGDVTSEADAYQWFDEGRTGLAHVVVNPAENKYWNGGVAISNYFNFDVNKEIEYTEQLAVPFGVKGAAGNAGSANFAVVNYSAYASSKPSIYFKDNVERLIESMYVIPTSYLVSVAEVGNYNAVGGLGENDYITVTISGVNKDGKTTGSIDYNLAENGKMIVKEWTKWDLSSLGEVAKIEFEINGNTVNDYGFSLPTYFAIDDISVLF